MANREKLGGHLQDRRWMARVLDHTYEQSNRLADWGYPYPVNDNGKSQRNSLQGPEYMRLMRSAPSRPASPFSITARRSNCWWMRRTRLQVQAACAARNMIAGPCGPGPW